MRTHHIRTIPFRSWSANAVARFTGHHDATSEQAQQTGCSGQSVYDHARRVLAAVAPSTATGSPASNFIEENAALRLENAQLQAWMFQTVEFPTAKRQQFAVTARAIGLSLNQTLVLRTILLGTAARPGRSTAHHRAQVAALAAGTVRCLDHSYLMLVLVGCLDAILFHRRLVLVGVEPHSMVWFIGTKADTHQGATWLGELRPWSELQTVVCEAAPGLQVGVAALQRERRDSGTGSVPLEKGLDVVHTKREARRVLKALWSRVERLWEQAEAASRTVEQARRKAATRGARPRQPESPGARRSRSGAMRSRRPLGVAPSRA